MSRGRDIPLPGAICPAGVITLNSQLSTRTVGVLQSAANLPIIMIAGGNHTDIQYAGPYNGILHKTEILGKRCCALVTPLL